MSVYVIPHGVNPEDYMQKAKDAGCDSIQVGLPEGMTTAGVLPQESLVASPTSIPPDSKTISTVTFKGLPGATGGVTFSVNGHNQSANLTNGTASIQVASATPGDTINITCGDVSTTVTVTQ